MITNFMSQGRDLSARCLSTSAEQPLCLRSFGTAITAHMYDTSVTQQVQIWIRHRRARPTIHLPSTILAASGRGTRKAHRAIKDMSRHARIGYAQTFLWSPSVSAPSAAGFVHVHSSIESRTVRRRCSGHHPLHIDVLSVLSLRYLPPRGRSH